MSQAPTPILGEHPVFYMAADVLAIPLNSPRSVESHPFFCLKCNNLTRAWVEKYFHWFWMCCLGIFL